MHQVRDLLAAAKDDPWWHAYCHVAIMLGLRPGELLGLRWDDVHLERGDVQVRQALKASGLAALKLSSPAARWRSPPR